MEKENWIGRESLRLVVLVLPIILLFAFWDQLPVGKPWQEGMRLSGSGTIGRYHLTALALLNGVLYGAFQLRYYYLPKTKADDGDSWQVLQLFCHLLLTLTLFLAAYRALDFKLAPALVLQYGIITLLLVLGSFLGAIPRNNMFGFRLSWTLGSNLLWQKTHRFAAQVWVFASVLMLFYPGWQGHDWVFPLYVGLLVLLPVSYSYYVYRQHLKKIGKLEN
jgi:uncharacterized membrane protein